MQLKLDEFGRITKDYPSTFYRLTNWMTGAFVDDYSSEAEATKASYASAHGGRYDHKISTMHSSRS